MVTSRDVTLSGIFLKIAFDNGSVCEQVKNEGTGFYAIDTQLDTQQSNKSMHRASRNGGPKALADNAIAAWHLCYEGFSWVHFHKVWAYACEVR